MKTILALTLSLTCLSAISRANLVYTDGAINGYDLGYTVSDYSADWHVSDSFTVTSATPLGSVTAGLWVDAGDMPGTISWEIGTTPFASDISSGTSATDNVFVDDVFDVYDVYASSFNVSGSVGPGTYYLTLNDGSTNPTFWDYNGGPSTAYQSPDASDDDSYGIGAESFAVFSTGVAVPDSTSTALLMALGAAALLFPQLRRRRS